MIEESEGWYKVFKGWYRKSLARKDAVWHRVHHVDSIIGNRPMARTVCGRRIPIIKCDFDMKPGNKCMQCEKSPGVVVETGRGFVPIGAISIPTKTAAITELKRLLKPRTYYLRIWGHEGVRITAKWESDVSISIYTETEIITKQRTKRVMTLEQIQADLGRFKSAIDCLCDASDTLAIAEKRKNKQKGKLTEEESMEYFTKLMYVAEK